AGSAGTRDDAPLRADRRHGRGAPCVARVPAQPWRRHDRADGAGAVYVAVPARPRREHPRARLALTTKEREARLESVTRPQARTGYSAGDSLRRGGALSSAASATRCRCVIVPIVLLSDIGTWARSLRHRWCPQRRWLSSRSETVIVSASHGEVRITSAA